MNDLKKIEKSIRRNNFMYRYSMLAIGIFISAIGYNLFMLNNDIVAGDVGGIAIITKNIIDPSLMILLLSIFLLIVSFIFLGKEKTIGSIMGSLLFPLFVYLTTNITSFIKIERDDLLLISIFAGLFNGFGSGLVFKYGFTTGGTDVLNQIVSVYGKMSIGKGMIVTDGLIVLIGGFFFGWTKVLYAIIILYITSVLSDRVVLGISSNKAFYIITEKEDEVKKYILNNLTYGITIIEGRGGYSNNNQKILLCLIPSRKYFEVKEGLELIDKKAFIIVTDAYQSEGGSLRR